MSGDRYLDELVRLMPPPERVFAPTTWEDAEAAIGVQFPDSFKAFLDTYGLGTIEPELYVMDPRRVDQFAYHARIDSDAVDYLPFEELPAERRPPYHGFPAPGRSLLSVAGNGNGDRLYIVVDNGAAIDDELWINDKSDWQRMRGPFCRLLADLLAGRNREALGRFDYWAWHLEPSFVAAPDSYL